MISILFVYHQISFKEKPTFSVNWPKNLKTNHRSSISQPDQVQKCLSSPFISKKSTLISVFVNLKKKPFQEISKEPSLTIYWKIQFKMTQVEYHYLVGKITWWFLILQENNFKTLSRLLESSKLGLKIEESVLTEWAIWVVFPGPFLSLKSVKYFQTTNPQNYSTNSLRFTAYGTGKYQSEL